MRDSHIMRLRVNILVHLLDKFSNNNFRSHMRKMHEFETLLYKSKFIVLISKSYNLFKNYIFLL